MRALLPVHGAIGCRQRRLRILAWREAVRPKGDAYRDRPAIPREARVDDHPSQLVGFVRRDDLVGACQEDAELVTAEAPDHIGRAGIATQYVGDVNQRGVARGVAVGVVDGHRPLTSKYSRLQAAP